MRSKRPAVRAITRIAESAVSEIYSLTPDQRKEMWTAVHGLTQSNCWWAEYQIRTGLLTILESLILDDETAAARAKAKQKRGKHAG